VDFFADCLFDDGFQERALLDVELLPDRCLKEGGNRGGHA
jgi:hypothetical protein